LSVFAVTGATAVVATGDKIMKISAVVAVSLAAAFVAPALAADSYYIVQDVKTKKCTVTETKPTSAETTVVSGDTVYKTKSEAQSGIKTTKVCTTE
jgi:carbamate kinase